jgi:hypothetical protein
MKIKKGSEPVKIELAPTAKLQQSRLREAKRIIEFKK